MCLCIYIYTACVCVCVCVCLHVNMNRYFEQGLHAACITRTYVLDKVCNEGPLVHVCIYMCSSHRFDAYRRKCDAQRFA